MKNIKMAPSNCYCGQSGDITLNMLECAKCRRWFHEECVKCLDLPMLFGDRFYIFICSQCNAGAEYLGRVELIWQEVAHLLLYNLNILEKKKYIHLNMMVSFLEENWERFHLFGPVASDKKNIHTKLPQTLQSFHSKFKCGKEVKKCKYIWALRVRVPPDAPDVLPSSARIQKDVVVWDFQVKDRAYHIMTVKKSTKNNLKNNKAKAKVPVTSSVRQKNGEVSKCRGSVPHNENGIHKAKHKSKHSKVLFNEDSARQGLLDSLIPFPSDFNNCNNPFEKSPTKENLKHFNSQNDKVLKDSKRRRDGENSSNMTVINGSHQFSDDGTTSRNSTSLLVTKDNYSQGTKENDFCIIGKRTTSTGKVQYLFQRDRAKMEEAVAEQEPLFQISIICKCSNCARYFASKGKTKNYNNVH